MKRFISIVVAFGAHLARCAVEFNGPSPINHPRITYAQQPDCPVTCFDYANVNSWTSYTSVKRLQRCEEPMLIQLSLASPLDDPRATLLIRSCTLGKQQSEAEMSLKSAKNPKKDEGLFDPGLETAPACLASGAEVTRDANVFLEDKKRANSTEVDEILEGMQKFFEVKDNCDESAVFSYYKNTVASVYVGSDYGKTTASSIISALKSSSGGIAQICGRGRSGTLGVFIDGSGNLAAAQRAAATWNIGKCVETEGRSNGKDMQKVKTWEIANQDDTANSSTSSTPSRPSLRSKQDAPQAKADGPCATHVIVSGDTCWNLAQKYGITTDKIDEFNKGKTWAWNGCNSIDAGQNMCVSEGTPPMPAEDPQAVCGPQKPGTIAPSDPSTSIADLNPCPLNACCSVHGRCGTFPDFCEIHAPPGTKLPGFKSTCISNCGSEIKKNGEPPSAFQRIGYYQSWNLDRPCITRKAKDANTDGSYTHIHWAFLEIDRTTLKPVVVDKHQQWTDFKNLKNVKRIVSFGGYSYSNDPTTKDIIRNALTSSGRQTFANNIAQFLNDEGLDGVDIDWEYPESVSNAYGIFFP
ncbi:glycoside hydrolase family 18 protein [Periconia macrospinosa]|uniref:Glycoside hydrolase family 18 protein n=1 Tax=Periconia macrospinosa TaxID=97972 RepID=A0A2V1D4G0_9PLEO|nr:glycoside hydrolase family 18 protein [Periconia macrospinosa]